MFEPQINHSLGLTNFSLYRACDNNTIYAGREHLSKERQRCFDAANSMQYRHCKVAAADPNFKPPSHIPTSSEHIVDANHVVVTSSVQTALDFLSGYQPRLNVVVDNEADRGYTNALIIYVPQARRVLIFHGPKVHADQFFMYERLERLGATCYAWGSLLEADYPNLVDIQDRHALLARTNNYQGAGLTRVADSMGLPTKYGFDDYAIYSGNTLPREAILYAVRDVTLPEAIRHAFAPSVGHQTTVRCAQQDYRLTPAQSSAWPRNQQNVTWCHSP